MVVVGLHEGREGTTWGSSPGICETQNSRARVLLRPGVPTNLKYKETKETYENSHSLLRNSSIALFHRSTTAGRFTRLEGMRVFSAGLPQPCPGWTNSRALPEAAGGDPSMRWFLAISASLGVGFMLLGER
jgi:hypothetical protein